MPHYPLMYRLGITPWERYEPAGIAAQLDREAAGRPAGRALDLGCGRGRFTPELARRGWETVGVDYVPAAIEAAGRRGGHGITYVVGDVTDLRTAGLGTFDLFLDIGCFQGFDGGERLAMGRSVQAAANPGATMVMLAFGPSRFRSVVGGVSEADVRAAFPDWTMITVEPAGTAGLGWPMNRTAPQWYRLRRPG